MEEKTVAEMRRRFYYFYHNTVKSSLPLLNERRKDRRFVIYWILSFIIFCVLVIVIQNIAVKIGLGIVFMVSNWCTKRSALHIIITEGTVTKEKVFDFTGEHEIKKIFMPAFLQIFGRLKWQKCSNDVSERYYEWFKQLNIIPYNKFLKYDDMISGSYNNVNLNILEVRYAGAYGVFLEYEMNKNFLGSTYILENALTNKNVKIKTSGFEKVKLEDIEFNKKYNVYSTNQVEARYVLTTGFMERFLNIKTAFKAKYIRAAFKAGKIVIFMQVKKDLFGMANLNKDADGKTFKVLFDEVLSVLELTEELKLNQKLGL